MCTDQCVSLHCLLDDDDDGDDDDDDCDSCDSDSDSDGDEYIRERKAVIDADMDKSIGGQWQRLKASPKVNSWLQDCLLPLFIMYMHAGCPSVPQYFWKI